MTSFCVEFRTVTFVVSGARPRLAEYR